jgi:hypothetical protein
MFLLYTQYLLMFLLLINKVHGVMSLMKIYTRWTDQGILRLLSKSKVRYLVPKTSPLGSVTIQLNVVHIAILCSSWDQFYDSPKVISTFILQWNEGIPTKNDIYKIWPSFVTFIQNLYPDNDAES